MPLFTQLSANIWCEDTAAGLGIQQRTRLQLNIKGITIIGDLLDFNKEVIESLMTNLRKPAKIAMLNAANVMSLQEVEPYQIFARSRMRLNVALPVVKYYSFIGRPLEDTNMAWSVLRNFEL